MKLFPLYILLLIGIASAFYISWLPDPQLGKYRNLPNWLARWADTNANMNIRIAVPLIMLGLLTGSWLISTKQVWHWWFISWLGLIIIVLSAEVGQLIVPKRQFDWGDVSWGVVGSLVGLLSSILLRTALKRLISVLMHQ